MTKFLVLLMTIVLPVQGAGWSPDLPSASSSCSACSPSLSLFLAELPIWFSGFLPGLLLGLVVAWAVVAANMERWLVKEMNRPGPANEGRGDAQ